MNTSKEIVMGAAAVLMLAAAGAFFLSNGSHAENKSDAPAIAVSADASAKISTRGEVEAVVKEYILNNPQILIESIDRMQQKAQLDQMQKMAETVQSRGKELTDAPGNPIGGNPKGDVTIVEFFDYHCGYCKQQFKTLNTLLETDKNLKIAFKEFPIFGDNSELGARAALAVNRVNPDKYFTYHGELMKMSGNFSEEALLKAAADLGLDREKVKAEMNGEDVKKQLAEMRALGHDLGLSGTPALVINKELIPGALSVEDLKAKIEAARKK